MKKYLALGMILLLVLPTLIVSTKTTAAPFSVPYSSCLAYDSFNRANGNMGTTEAIGPYGTACPELSWSWVTPANWSVASSAAVGSPTIGANEVTNGTFDADASWTKGTNWVITGGTANITPSGSSSYLSNSAGTVSTIGTWYQLSYDISNYSAGTLKAYIDGTVSDALRSSNGTYLFTTPAGAAARVMMQANSAAQYSIDNLIRRPLTLNTLFTTVPLSTANIVATVNITMTAGSLAGLVLNVDSSSSPANFIIAYHNGTNVRLDKAVAGVYTNLINSAATYVAGATLQVTTTRSGANLLVDVKYNGATVGTQQTISDAGIIDNTLAGLFSTYASNTFDNFYVVSNTANTPTPTISSTPTNTFTHTYTPTNTFTNTYTPTNTFTPTNTATSTPTDTATPTNTATATRSSTPTRTMNATEIFTATYEAGVPIYTAIAEDATPTVILLSALCGIIIVCLLVWLAIWLKGRQK